MTRGLDTFLVDSNVLVYSVDVTEAAKQDIAVDVIRRLTASRRGAVSIQVLGEFFNVSTRKLRSPLTQNAAEEIVQTYLDSWEVVSLTEPLLKEAIRCAQQHQLSYWDGLIWAAARQAGAATLLSEDMQDGRNIEGVRVLNPLLPSFDLSLLS